LASSLSFGKGAEIRFPVRSGAAFAAGEQLTVYTTRPDTVFGATYMVLAPEHPLLPMLTTDAQVRRFRRTSD
jgi:leucyl-tRNA synthetase